MPDILNHDFVPEMRSSFTGRVRNYHLPATSKNTLMPVFEGTTNALYAIQERFPEEKWTDEGVISITVLREPIDNPDIEDDPVVGFEILDNGLGLNDDLFNHFQELDTQYRAEKNGRGIGRLSWLKVFKNVRVSSVFEREQTRIKRSFDFKLSDQNPFQNYEEALTDEPLGTRVTLRGFREKFGEKAYLDADDIKREILAHFVAIFAQPKRLKVNLHDGNSIQNLSDFFFDSITLGGGKEEIETVGGVLKVRHMLVEKSLAPIENSLVYCAADRAVVTQGLSELLGMKSIEDKERGSMIYIGLVEGPTLDEHLNHERTGFDFGDIPFEDINRKITESVKVFLATYIEEKREKSRALLKQVLEINPLYSSAIGDIEEYAKTMPLNWDEKKLVEAVAVKRYRAQKALVKQVEKLDANSASMSDSDFADKVRSISRELGDSEKSALAQYVVERKLVIALLQKRRQFDLRKSEHQSEALVHEVFCPLGVTSDVLDYDDHNLWLLDDRLAYYTFIASDRPLKTFARDKGSVENDSLAERSELEEIGRYSEGGEPDLAIFKRPMLFRRSKTPDPVVIVEFKAPGKTKYTGNKKDNPVIQIRKYIRTLQDKEAYDYDGNRISDINKQTPFHCYLVAEGCVQLYELLESHGIWKQTPDGNGRFGYLDDLNAYFEFIPYDQVLTNAKLRNEAFFKHLNLEEDLGDVV